MTPTQITEAQRLADRLDSSDPDFDDCTDAAELLSALAAQAAQAQQPDDKALIERFAAERVVLLARKHGGPMLSLAESSRLDALTAALDVLSPRVTAEQWDALEASEARRITQPAREGLTDAQIEAIAVEHEDFGFGRVGARGVSTHGFSPEGLVAFARAIEAAHGIGTAGAQEATR